MEIAHVRLTAKASKALEQNQVRTGDSKTDIINRALSVYEYIDSLLAAGDELFIKSKAVEGQFFELKIS